MGPSIVPISLRIFQLSTDSIMWQIPHFFPQANRKAERVVGNVKGLWKGGGDKERALLTYRSTPLGNRYLPAQLLMGRQLRTTLPQLPKKLSPCWPGMTEFRCSETKGRRKQQQYYNSRHRAQPLPVLKPGQNVWLPLEKMQGSVVSQSSSPRSYLIGTEDGVTRRNRAHLRPIHQSEQVLSSDTESESNGHPCLLQNKLKDILMWPAQEECHTHLRGWTFIK